MGAPKWLASWFSVPWPVVPAQPVLFLFIWIAGIHVAATPNNARLGFEEAGFSPAWYWAWNVLVLTSPVLVGCARWMFRYRRGRWLVAAFWLRLGGDMGVLAALVAHILTRVIVLHRMGIGDSPLFSLISLSGVAVLVSMMVVRDVVELSSLESHATEIQRWRDLV